MGILNVTPDSFFDGGKYRGLDAALARAEKMADEGADIFDVGGESTRPGSKAVSIPEELARTLPVVRQLSRRYPRIPISIDTQKSEVARRALESGAAIVNDVSALRFDPEMAGVVRSGKCEIILMHMKGTPRTMQKLARYGNVVSEVKTFLLERMRFAVSRGISKSKIWVDPGIGFGKTADHNLNLLAHLESLGSLGAPLLIGASRKSFIGTLSGAGGNPAGPEHRLAGSLAVAAWSCLQGASVLRVHDVGETKKMLRVLEEIVKIRHT